MSTQRIKTGFHRIGLMLAVVCGVPAALSILASFPAYYDVFGGADELWQILLAGGAVGLVLAALGYASAWTLGWIVAGFAGEAD